MGKLILLFILANLTQNNFSSDLEKDQAKEVQEYEYWRTFSKTFEETADFWQAESAALEAEEIAEDRTEITAWLAKNKDNISEIMDKDRCES